MKTNDIPVSEPNMGPIDKEAGDIEFRKSMKKCLKDLIRQPVREGVEINASQESIEKDIPGLDALVDAFIDEWSCSEPRTIKISSLPLFLHLTPRIGAMMPSKLGEEEGVQPTIAFSISPNGSDPRNESERKKQDIFDSIVLPKFREEYLPHLFDKIFVEITA